MKLQSLCLAVFLCGIAGAQAPASTVPEQVQAMRACSFMTGQWSGEGWISFGPDQRRTFRENEDVSPKLDGLILQIDGTGKNDAGAVVHGALAILSFDPETKHYDFLAYDQTGHSLKADADCHDGAMTWSIQAGPRQMRYHIELNSKGQWYETGDVSMDGHTWHSFFQMTLDRVGGK